MANILTKRKFKKHNKLNKKTKKNKWNRKTKKQVGGAGSGPIRSQRRTSRYNPRARPVRSRSPSPGVTSQVTPNKYMGAVNTYDYKNPYGPNEFGVATKHVPGPAAMSNVPAPTSENNMDILELHNSDPLGSPEPEPTITPVEYNQKQVDILFEINLLESIVNQYLKGNISDEEFNQQLHTRPYDLVEFLDTLSELEDLFFDLGTRKNMRQFAEFEGLKTTFIDKLNTLPSSLANELAAISLEKFSIDLPEAQKTKQNTYKIFFHAYLDYLYLSKQLISLISPVQNIVLIDVENLISSAKTDERGPKMNKNTAYHNFMQIIRNFSSRDPNITFILLSHHIVRFGPNWSGNEILNKITEHIYIINANCTERPCEKDDFILILMLEYLKETYNCLVISHDKYSWYDNKDQIVRATISPATHQNLIIIDTAADEHLRGVKNFAYSLNRV